MLAPLALLVAAAGVLVQAAPIEENPYMIENPEAKVILNHEHPAFGAELAVPLEIFNANNDTEVAPLAVGGGRRLEQTSHDINALESYFRKKMVVNVNQLPRKAEFKPSPWPGNYWPTYEDGINVQWDPSQPSASEKYARAFGLDPVAFMERMSRRSGILAHSGRRACKTSSDCSGLNDGSACAIRRGATSGYCIPTWFGVCHAWAPAAILEPEPRCPVIKNGVKFELNDIKALMTQFYDGANLPTIFTGARYNGPDNAAKDQYGRFVDAAYRDLGPGYFHIAATNLLGLLNTSFVIDVTAGAEVWNQPVRKYEILEQTPMTLAQGATRFFNTPSYPFNPAATKLMYVRMNFQWIVESTENARHVDNSRIDRYTAGQQYQYVLELDANDNIVGGEWVGNSMSRHPDFLWFSTRRPAAGSTTSTGLSYDAIKGLLNASIQATC